MTYSELHLLPLRKCTMLLSISVQNTSEISATLNLGTQNQRDTKETVFGLRLSLLILLSFPFHACISFISFQRIQHLSLCQSCRYVLLFKALLTSHYKYIEDCSVKIIDRFKNLTKLKDGKCVSIEQMEMVHEFRSL